MTLVDAAMDVALDRLRAIVANGGCGDLPPALDVLVCTIVEPTRRILASTAAVTVSVNI